MLYLPLPLHVYIEVEKKQDLAFSLSLYVIPSPTPTCLYRGREKTRELLAYLMFVTNLMLCTFIYCDFFVFAIIVDEFLF